MKRTTRALALLLLVCASRAEDAEFEVEEEEEEEDRATILFYKKMSPLTDYAVGSPINVTLSVFNKGPGNAYSIMVADDTYKMDKFRIAFGGNNFSLDFLNAGDSYEHSFTVVPIRKTWHRVRPAKMRFIDGVEGENSIMHYSNTLPEIRIAAQNDELEAMLLSLGRIVTLNMVKTKAGWTRVGILVALFLVSKLFTVLKGILKKRRRLRVLEEAKEW